MAKTQRHIIHKHSTLSGITEGLREKLKVGEIAINVGSKRPSVVFYAQENSGDTGFTKAIEIMQPDVETNSTDNLHPQFVDAHTLKGFEVSLSDEYENPDEDGTMKFQSGETIDSVAYKIADSINGINQDISDINAKDFATINEVSVDDNVEFSSAKLNGEDLIVSAGTASNFTVTSVNGLGMLFTDGVEHNMNIAKVNHNDSVAMDSAANDYRFATINGNDIVHINDAYDDAEGEYTETFDIEIPLTVVEAGNDINIETSGINNTISFAGLTKEDGDTTVSSAHTSGRYVSGVVVSGTSKLIINYAQDTAKNHKIVANKIVTPGVSGNAITGIQVNENVDGNHVISFGMAKEFSEAGHKHVSSDITDAVSAYTVADAEKLLNAKSIEKMVFANNALQTGNIIVSDGGRSISSVGIVASAVTSASGTNAYANTEVSDGNLVIGLSIPRGDKGERGASIDRIDAPTTLNSGTSEINTYSAYNEDNEFVGGISVYNGGRGVGFDRVEAPVSLNTGNSQANVYTAYTTDGLSAGTIIVYNGSQGPKGDNGKSVTIKPSSGECTETDVHAFIYNEESIVSSWQQYHLYLLTAATASDFNSFEDLGLFAINGQSVSSAVTYTTNTGSSEANYVTLHLEDGTEMTPFVVYNGAKGEQGEQGIQGPRGYDIISITAPSTLNTGSSEANIYSAFTNNPDTPFVGTFTTFNGEQGIQGIGFSAVTMPATINSGSGEYNEYSAWTTDGAYAGSIRVYNGLKGEQGIQGPQGEQGGSITIQSSMNDCTEINLDAFVYTGVTNETFTHNHLYLLENIDGEGNKTWKDLGAFVIEGRGISGITSTRNDSATTVTIILTDGVSSSFTIYDGAKGADGNDGVSVETMNVNKVDSATTIEFILSNGASSSFTVYDGYQGNDGIGIETVTTSKNGSANTVTFTLTDGISSSYTVYDGVKGDDGVGIESVTTASTVLNGVSGVVVTMTLTDNTSSSFTVYNGHDIDETNFYNKTEVDNIVSGINKTITDNEFVVSTALNDLNDRFNNYQVLSEKVQIISGHTAAGNYPTVNAVYDYIIASMSNVQNTSERTDEIDGPTADDEYPTVNAVYYYVNSAVTVATDGLQETSEKVSIITSEVSETEYPTAKAVYNYVSGAISDAISTIVDTNDSVSCTTTDGKAYLVGVANTEGVQKGNTNSKIFMSGGCLYINDIKVAIITDISDALTTAVNYKGATNTVPSTASVGDLYIAGTNLTLTAAQSATGAAQTAETGDFIIARTNTPTWDVVEKNIDGAVTAANSLEDGYVVIGKGNRTVATSLPLSAVCGTTYDGHYTPSITATSITGARITGVTYDGKGHIMSVSTAATDNTDTMVHHENVTAATGYLLGATSTANSTTSAITSDVHMVNNALYAGGGFFQTSDERMKDFGESVVIDLDKLSKLPKKYFTWKGKEEKGQHIGTSAQELQKMYPELVKTDATGKLSVDYATLSVVALAAIDKLHKENDELRKRIESIEEYLTRKNGR